MSRSMASDTDLVRQRTSHAIARRSLRRARSETRELVEEKLVNLAICSTAWLELLKGSDQNRAFLGEVEHFPFDLTLLISQAEADVGMDVSSDAAVLLAARWVAWRGKCNTITNKKDEGTTWDTDTVGYISDDDRSTSAPREVKRRRISKKTRQTSPSDEVRVRREDDATVDGDTGIREDID
eukprot:TRINITY_DN25113_c0_g1_i4.p2 TRINITY_DN25113_c0_g1~~TRINITY_DN25113_c0_g1_i4.p2  ORF type:complete len:182 (-),score=35.06 TRINITY_DN25113_c0_g1_i4:7-552(-)